MYFFSLAVGFGFRAVSPYGPFFMKILYTILFFADTLILILLAFLFLHVLDQGVARHLPGFVLLLAGMLICIILLVFFLHRYTQTRPRE